MKTMTNLKKVYVKPYSDFVLVCNNKHILDAHTTRMSYFDDGHGGGGKITDGDGEGDAKEMHWDDSWNDFSMESNDGENYW